MHKMKKSIQGPRRALTSLILWKSVIQEKNSAKYIYEIKRSKKMVSLSSLCKAYFATLRDKKGRLDTCLTRLAFFNSTLVADWCILSSLSTMPCIVRWSFRIQSKPSVVRAEVSLCIKMGAILEIEQGRQAIIKAYASSVFNQQAIWHSSWPSRCCTCYLVY